jgi:hypothetical protein
MPNRREFLLNCAALAAATAVSPAAAWGTVSSPAEVSLDAISLEEFFRQMNTLFILLPSEGAVVNLELIQVRDLLPLKSSWANSPDAGNEKFSLTFRGPREQPLEQNTYMFAHQAIGCFSLFIVPVVVADQDQCYYEAVFNRPVPKNLTSVRPERVSPRQRKALRPPRSF